MWSENELQLTHRYSQEIRREYNQRSRVPILAIPQRERNAQAPDFLKFARRFKMSREFFEEGHIIIVHPFAEFIERSEYQYLIDILKETSRNRISSDTSPDIEMINSGIMSISSLTEPNFVIIPIAFYVGLHALNRASGVPVIQYDGGHAYYNYASRQLRILWSNKFINLNEIIIGNSRDSLWLFKSANGDNRLTVRFDLDETGTNAILLVQTVFRYHPPSAENVSVIEFPESLCRIE